MKNKYADSFSAGDKCGWIVFSQAGLFSLNLPKRGSKQPKNTIIKKNPITKDLEAYFKGENPSFGAKIDWSGISDFEIKTLKGCRLIEYGKTVSYKELASKIEKDNFFRALGNALARNRLPVIIPCHRVVRSNGELGGFSGGASVKKELLNLEKNGQNRK